METWLQKVHAYDQLLALAGPVALKIAFAILIFFGGKWLAEWLIKGVRLAMSRGRMDETLADFLSNILYGLALTVVVFSSLHQLGVEATSAAAVLGGAALAIGLSLQQQLSSLAAGVILIIFRPFKKGDFIELGSGVKGTVEEIKIVHTRLHTSDNRELIVPNSAITTNNIINYSVRQLRRVELIIGIGYDSDLLRAKQLLHEIVADTQGALKTPEPTINVNELGASSVNLNVWCWVKTSDYALVRGNLLESIKLRFDREGVNLPFPQMDLHVRQLPKT
ncbi:MAG TPA: mechanosensitive ion channel domain-containing protein [Stenotrophobium sp.]|jgi:small conductance mechanosensitive channel|nr:mechanosensitive ion channel domain-containing protein [Stenotrophobium sp.]